jgi:hypothetical protein
MRIAVMLVVLAALGSPAAADSPRYRPAPGTNFTYRLMVTVNSGGQERTVGQVYRVKTSASDGATIDGTLTPLALVWLCPEADTSIACKQAQLLPGRTARTISSLRRCRRRFPASSARSAG